MRQIVLERPTEVVMTDLNAAKRERAKPLGADEAYDPRDPESIDALRTQLCGSADVVFDCVAIQATIDQAIALAHKGGTVIVEGCAGVRRPPAAGDRSGSRDPPAGHRDAYPQRHGAGDAHNCRGQGRRLISGHKDRAARR